MSSTILNASNRKEVFQNRPLWASHLPPSVSYGPVNSHSPNSSDVSTLKRNAGRSDATRREPKFWKSICGNHFKGKGMFALHMIMLVAIVIVTLSLVWTMVYRKNSKGDKTIEIFTTTPTTARKTTEDFVSKSENLPPSRITSLLIGSEGILEVNGVQDTSQMVHSKKLRISCLTNSIRKSMDDDDVHYNSTQYIVESLDIAGPVSEEWLEFILRRSHNLITLKINLDQVCRGAKIKNRETLPNLKVNSCTSLEVTNTNICDIDEWFYIWKFPSCRDVTIKGTNLSRDNCIDVISFLKKMEALKSVIFQNSNIDEDCRGQLDNSFKNITLSYTNKEV